MFFEDFGQMGAIWKYTNKKDLKGHFTDKKEKKKLLCALQKCTMCLVRLKV